MTGGWLHTGYAWGLLALLIPLVIHLWNRKEGKVIRVGSVQLVQASESARASRIRLHEILLWLIRSVLVGALVALLVGWIQGPKPGSLAEPTTRILVDPLVAEDLPPGIFSEGESAYWLCSDTKTLKEDTPAVPANGWRILTQLAKAEYRPDTVVVYTRLNYLRWPDPAPVLPFAVVWKVVPAQDPVSVWVHEYPGVREWQAVLDEYRVTMVAKELDGGESEPLRIYANLPEAEQTYLTTCLQQIAGYLRLPIRTVDNPDRASVVFDWENTGVGNAAVRRVSRGVERVNFDWWEVNPQNPQEYNWQYSIHPDSVGENLWAELPLALIELLFPEPAIPYAVPPEYVVPANWGGSMERTVQREAHGFLLLVVVILVGIERMVAAWRKA